MAYKTKFAISTEKHLVIHKKEILIPKYLNK